MPPFETPIVFIAFNRPEVTAMTFAEIRKKKPKILLLIADGPRLERPGEAAKCKAVREILKNVDWDCEVFTNFSETNMGCKARVASGLTWAFNLVEEAIILEDDCLPHPTFFDFSAKLLEKYRHDTRIMSIGGSCLVQELRNDAVSYTYSQFPFIWGWATWRRAWALYDVSMKDWPTYKGSPIFRKAFLSRAAYRHYASQLNKTFFGKIDTWDYQFTFAAIKHGGLSVVPTRNLIRNIGFGPDATHTTDHNEEYSPQLSNIPFPLIAPNEIKVDRRIDHVWMTKQFSLGAKVIRKLKAQLRNAKAKL